jgi:hypothetical protein
LTHLDKTEELLTGNVGARPVRHHNSVKDRMATREGGGVNRSR